MIRINYQPSRKDYSELLINVNHQETRGNSSINIIKNKIINDRFLYLCNPLPNVCEFYVTDQFPITLIILFP